MNTATYAPDEDRLAAAIAEYLEARQSGTPVNPSDWFARYPELAGALHVFLDDSDGIATGLRAFSGCAREPDLQTADRFIGDYELLERVGGNMGIVYRARQQSLPREVAVKVLLRAGALDRARFRSEAEAMARLRHPHIVPIIEVARGAEVPFFSMEWCPGGTLADRMGEYRRDPTRAAELVECIARAVHHAHLRGLLHRDLKPANVLFDAFGHPRVADFGLAVPLAGADASDGPRAGTPAYMAPEQLTGEVTVATDVYGTGAILYELLTGRPPSGAETLTLTLERVRVGAPAPPSELDPRVDPDLDAVCRKCLAKEPAARYPSALEVAADLERYRRGQPTLARPLGPLGRVARVLRQARAATDFRALAPGLFAMAAFVFCSNATAFALLRIGAAEPWVWASVFASYVPLFGLLARERWLTGQRHSPARLHLWSIWAGHAGACLSLFVGLRLAAGADFAHGIELGYVGSAGLNALAFTVMGSLFAGRQYLLGLIWAAAAVLMGALLAYAPLLYAVLMAGCSLFTGLQLKALLPCGAPLGPQTQTDSHDTQTPGTGPSP
jgi:serine/threonine-protein kinase